MALRVEYITKTTDYDLGLKQEVLEVLSRQNLKTKVCIEKIRIPYEYILDDTLPLDSKTSWRISPNKKNATPNK